LKFLVYKILFCDIRTDGHGERVVTVVHQNGGSNPQWNHQIRLKLQGDNTNIAVIVMNKNTIMDKQIALGNIRMDDIMKTDDLKIMTINVFHPEKPTQTAGTLNIRKIRFEAGEKTRYVESSPSTATVTVTTESVYEEKKLIPIIKLIK